ncbi:MAG: hypothetical protein ABI623_05160 [bacterium]
MNTLLLTATITPPPGVPDLLRTDPAVRLGDYTEALKFYLTAGNLNIDQIVFADNSNSDLSSLKNLVCNINSKKKVEFISFNGLDHPPANGRGYGEFKMLDYVMANSNIIRSASETDRMWKVTGRYVVINLCDVIERAPHNYDLYCNIRRWPRPWMDLYLLSWTKKGYNAILQDVHRELQEDIIKTSPEARMWEILQDSFHKANIVPRFNVQPFVEGIVGFDNRNLAGGSNLIKFYLRSFARRYFPWIWI